MSFRILGLSPDEFQPLFGETDEQLAAKGIQRMIVDAQPGYPDRITLTDLPIGASVLLMNYEHQSAATPYRASHAIFVAENANERFDQIDEVPEAWRVRTLSVRAFDAEGHMQDADLIKGHELAQTIATMFANPEIAYLHAHYAARGCYAGRIERAP